MILLPPETPRTSRCWHSYRGSLARAHRLLGRLIGGLYWGRERILAQVHAAQRLRGQGVSTPEVLAAGWRSVAGPLHHQAIIPKIIPGAINLYEASRNLPPGLRRRTILRESAALVRRMHDAGFLHADLNVTNIVLEPGARSPLVHIVDLDRGRLQSRVDLSGRALNLARLLRSYEKWLAVEAPLSGREELYFLRCYARSERAMVRWLWVVARAGSQVKRHSAGRTAQCRV